MQDKPSSPEQQPAQTQENQPEAPHKHNPFEEKGDHLTKEEEENMEEFKEAQTERD